MNVLDQKKEMCLSFDTPPSPFHVQKVGVFAHVLKQNYTLMYYTLMYNLYICH